MFAVAKRRSRLPKLANERLWGVYRVFLVTQEDTVGDSFVSPHREYTNCVLRATRFGLVVGELVGGSTRVSATKRRLFTTSLCGIVQMLTRFGPDEGPNRLEFMRRVLERVLGIRISPPPSVPAVEPDIRGAVTIRQQLELHRNDANCAACHARIDPPGLALEAFDVMGGFRDRYRAIADDQPRATGVGINGQAFAFYYALPVDCAGTMHDGSPFKDVRELKSILLRDEKAIARNLLCQLMIYATGSPITVSDKEEVEAILQQAAPTNYGVRSMIHAIVASDLFLYK